MKSDAQLLEQYKDEKALVIGGINERTGLEDFPTFKEWKLEYMKEYAETHDMDNPLSMEDAVAALEDELAADDELLDEADLAALAADETPETEEEDPMTDEVTTPAAEAEATPAAPEATTEAPAKPKAAKKKAAKKAPVKKVAAKKRPPSKAGEAQKVFDKLYPKVLDGKKTRKDIIDELVGKVGLTANGAATYYQKMKKAAG